MRTKTELSERPSLYSVSREDENAILTFYEDVEEVQREDATVFSATAYTINLPWSDDLAERIDTTFDKWLEKAKNESYEEAAKQVREKRNALLAATDKDMAFDRLQITLPENITAITLLAGFVDFIKSLKKIVRSDMATYRQALRDISAQQGFPYDVIFPQKPQK